jgi:heme A synthase
VHSHQAALSVPDWPLSYGRVLLTRWTGNTAWEQVHRLAAAIVIVVHILLRLALRRWGGISARIERWAVAASALLALQVLLGGVVVLSLNPPWVGALHVVLAQLFAALAIVLARACAEPVSPPRAASRWLALLPWLLGVQIALGAVSRHPPAGRGGFIASMLAHAVLGLILVGLAIGTGAGLWEAGERWRSMALLGLALGQLAVGLLVFFIAPEPLTETWPPPSGFAALHAAHHLLAALLLGTAAQARPPGAV